MSTFDHGSRKRPAFIVAITVGFLLTCGARAQDFSLQQALFGKDFPLRLQLKDFNADWRRVTVHSTATANGNVAVNVNGNTKGSASQNNINGALGGTRNYFTKGQTIWAGGRSFLVAYHLPGNGLDLGTLLQAVATKNPPSLAALTPESSIPLSLLDLNSVGALEDIRVFDMASEIADSEKMLRSMTELFKAQDSGSGKGSDTKPSAEDTGGDQK